MKTGWTFEDEIELLRLYFLERKSLKETARAMDREPRSVRRKLDRLRTVPLQLPYKILGAGRPPNPAEAPEPQAARRTRRDYPIATIPKMKTARKETAGKLPRQPYRPFTVKETAH